MGRDPVGLASEAALHGLASIFAFQRRKANGAGYC
jgi:hypothetical protein